MGMILRIASSRIVGQGDIVGRSGYFSLNLSANSVMRGRLDARRTLKSLVADLRIGNDPSLLYANMEQKNKAIVKFLESNGIAKEEISIAPPEVIDMQAERYGNRDIAYRYNATSVITVTSKNVDKVRKLMSEQAELLKQGIAISGGDYRYNVVYEFTGLNDVKPQMIEEATKNARAAAEKFAKDSDSSLGKIRNASQGQFSISDRDANTPYIKSIRVVTTVNYYLRR